MTWMIMDLKELRRPWQTVVKNHVKNLGICCPITLQQITPRTSDGTLLLDTMVVFFESKWDRILEHSTTPFPI